MPVWEVQLNFQQELLAKKFFASVHEEMFNSVCRGTSCQIKKIASVIPNKGSLEGTMRYIIQLTSEHQDQKTLYEEIESYIDQIMCDLIKEDVRVQYQPNTPDTRSGTFKGTLQVICYDKYRKQTMWDSIQCFTTLSAQESVQVQRVNSTTSECTVSSTTTEYIVPNAKELCGIVQRIFPDYH